MRLSPSAHLDTFCRDRLPAPDQWPEFRFDLPELHYPERLNCAVELLDATAARDGADRRAERIRAERNLDLRRGRPPH
jgi:2-aminobenzoate-CoA ligase